MPSKVSFEQSTEQDGLGVATVVFTDATSKEVATYSDRIDSRDADNVRQFVAAARKHRQAELAKAVAIPKVAQKIQAILDAAETP